MTRRWFLADATRGNWLRFFCAVFLILIGSLAGLAPVVADDEPVQDQDSSSASVRWAIAIHGGAGGVPTEWSDRRRQTRTAALRSALSIGRDRLAAGGTAVDVVEAVIRSLEDHPAFNAGRGAVVNADGKAELDASIMDGRDRSCGAVAGVTRTKNPISLARLVMTETPHVLLVGPGADRFATDQGVPLVEPDYFLGRSAIPAIGDQERHFGTVGCVVLDTRGDLAAGTSTGGTSKKLPGRVGDSPIVGAGTFADNLTCAVSGTGMGEEYIRHAVAYDVAAQMAYAKRTLDEAVGEIMTRRLDPDVGGLIAVSADGDIVLQHNTPGMSCAAADSSGRFDTYLAVPGGGRPTEVGQPHPNR